MISLRGLSEFTLKQPQLTSAKRANKPRWEPSFSGSLHFKSEKTKDAEKSC
jgi:hypothetical protein